MSVAMFVSLRTPSMDKRTVGSTTFCTRETGKQRYWPCRPDVLYPSRNYSIFMRGFCLSLTSTSIFLGKAFVAFHEIYDFFVAFQDPRPRKDSTREAKGNAAILVRVRFHFFSVARPPVHALTKKNDEHGLRRARASEFFNRYLQTMNYRVHLIADYFETLSTDSSVLYELRKFSFLFSILQTKWEFYTWLLVFLKRKKKKKIKWYWAIFDNVRYVKVERRWNFAILKQSSLSRLALAKKKRLNDFR